MVRVIRKDVEDRVCEIMVENADKKLEAISVTAENGKITVKPGFKATELPEQAVEKA